MGFEDDGGPWGLLAMMLELRRQFGGDLDRALILLFLIMEGSPASETGSASVLARMTCIPRESVRRKLESMRTASQVFREANGRWCVSDSTRESLRWILASPTRLTLLADIRSFNDRIGAVAPGEGRT